MMVDVQNMQTDWTGCPEKQALRGVSALLREELVVLVVYTVHCDCVSLVDSLHPRIAFEKKLFLCIALNLTKPQPITPSRF